MEKLSIHDQYLVMCLILFMAAAYLVIVNPMLSKKNIPRLKKIHSSCLVPCQHAAGLCRLSHHGHNHTRMDPENIPVFENCFMTFWGAAHFAMWAAVGFFCPDLAVPAFVIGVSFECFEAVTPKLVGRMSLNHDTMDVLFNTMGFFAGRAAGKYFNK